MNYSIIIYIIGWILKLEAVFMLLPCATALIYRESEITAFLLTMADVYKRQVSVRSRFLGDEGAKDLDAFIADLQKEIKNRENRKVEVSEETK